MLTNRIRQFDITEQNAPRLTFPVAVRQPANLGYVTSNVGYPAVAMAWPHAHSFQHIYQLAYERAKEATRVPLFIRRLYSVWN